MILTQLILFSFFNGALSSDVTPAPAAPTTQQAGGTSKKKKKFKKVIRLSDLDERERLEAAQELIAIVPAAPRQLYEEVEVDDDDELIALVLSKVLH